MTLRFDRGRYYEDADLGDEYGSRARTITEADVVAFAGLTGDYGPMYTDETYGRRTAVGGRAGHGLLGLGVVEGFELVLTASQEI